MKSAATLYFDYQASTPLDPIVNEEMQRYNDSDFANPHSAAHSLGQTAAEVVDKAKHTIADVISSAPDEIIFTSGATESNNQAIASVLFSNNADRDIVLVSAIEHKCVSNAAAFFAQKLGYTVKQIPVTSSGLIDIEAYQALLSDRVVMVSIMAVNNEIGSIQPITTLCELAHQHGALFHCDAAQAPTAIDIDVKQWDVDMMSLSAHKVYGPKGIGALFMKNRLQATLPPFIQGGGQQDGMRSGTLAPALCLGFAKAMELAKQNAIVNRQHLVNLQQYFLKSLNVQGIEYKLNGSETDRHPGNINIQFINQDANALLTKMQPHVAASTGSACNSDMILISHVLKAIGLSDEEALSSLRFSFGQFSTEEHIDQAIETIKQAISDS